MASKKQYGSQNGVGRPAPVTEGRGEGYNASFRGYLNYTATELEKANFDVWAGSQSLWDTLAFEVLDGVNLALKYDPKNRCCLASATQRREGSVNAGLCVTARASEPWKAFARLLFLLAILSKGERWEDTVPLAQSDRW